jgi:selenoprotein W-related protein
LPRATRAAAALKEELELESELIKGSGGIFEVAVDGKVVAKKSLGQFPSEKDVVDAVGKAVGA